MKAVDKLLNLASAEVGYLEKKSAAQLDDKTANAGNKNYTKYARDLDAIPSFYNGRKQGSSWCDVFVDWCFVQAFGVEVALKLLCQVMGGCGAGVKYSAQYYKAKGQFLERDPHPGDQIFFVKRKGLTVTNWLHTGLVEKVEGGYVYTIEGNTSGASGIVSNGGGVCRKKYKLNSVNIGGYGRPDWSLVKEEHEMTEKEIQTMVDKAVDKAVKPLEEALAETIRAVYPASYHKVEELPEWARPVARRLMDAGIVKGDGAHEINLVNGAMNLGAAAALDKLRLEMVGRDA